jgi:hypothetical protein
VARLLNPVREAGRFSAVIQTVSRRSYALQYKNSLGGTNWTAVMTTAGNGTLRVLSDPAATAAQRFYRMQQW